MRRLVGRVRNKPDIWRPVGKLVPKGQAIFRSLQHDLGPLGHLVSVDAAQCKAVDQLLGRQEAYLHALSGAQAIRCVPEAGPIGEPIGLPPPGKRSDFGVWRDQETNFISEVSQGQAFGHDTSLEKLIGLARLACNCSHELQNLSTAPRGGWGSEAHRFLKKLDQLGGQCENASRASMVLAHRAHQRQSPQPLKKVADRALFLQRAAGEGAALLQRAASAAEDGGVLVPTEAFQVTLDRLLRLALLLHRAVPAAQRQRPQRRAKAPAAVTLMNVGSQCPGCSFAVTRSDRTHCCKRCARHPGRHGPKCEQRRAAAGTEPHAAI